MIASLKLTSRLSPYPFSSSMRIVALAISELASSVVIRGPFFVAFFACFAPWACPASYGQKSDYCPSAAYGQ